MDRTAVFRSIASANPDNHTASVTGNGNMSAATPARPEFRLSVQWRHHHFVPRLGGCHSHSMVAGGFPEMSYVTREMPSISLIILRDT